MLVIQNVEYSKNPVNTSEAFIIKVEVKEITVKWIDFKAASWSNLLGMTWQDAKNKPLAPWSDITDNTWKDLLSKTWESIKYKKY